MYKVELLTPDGIWTTIKTFVSEAVADTTARAFIAHNWRARVRFVAV